MQVLSDDEWELIEPFMPCSDGKRGRRFRDHRVVVEGIVYRYRTGIAWRDLPGEFGPWQTVWKRHRAQADVDAHLTPTAPTIAADHLHPRAWNAAASVWDTGQYGAALQQASIALSAHIRTKASSPLRDRKLVTQIFSPDAPKPGQPRLHFPGDHSDEAWQARQQGLHHLAQGASAGIRNITAHEDTQWHEHEALELLAVLSTIARWTDSTELHTTD